MAAFFKATIAVPGENFVHTNGQDLDVRGQLRNSTGGAPVTFSCRVLDSNGVLQSGNSVLPAAQGFSCEFIFNGLVLPAGESHELLLRATVMEAGKLCSSTDQILIGAQNP